MYHEEIDEDDVELAGFQVIQTNLAIIRTNHNASVLFQPSFKQFLHRDSVFYHKNS